MQLATKFVPCGCSPAKTGSQTTATSKLFDFMSDTTLHTAGEHARRLKSAMFSRIFSVSWTALRSNWMYLMTIFHLDLFYCSCFMFYATCSSPASKFSVKLIWGRKDRECREVR